MDTEPIQIETKTVTRLRKYVSLENDGKTYGLIGKTAAEAINEYLDLESIQIDTETATRLRKYVSSEGGVKTHELIGKTAAKAINEYLNLIELRDPKNSAGNK